VQSLRAAWRVSLHRTRSDWPIVAAAGLIALLAATLLAAGPIYSSAVSLAGLHRELGAAPVADAAIEVVARVDPAEAAEADAALTDALASTLAPVGIDVVLAGASDSFTLPGQDPDDVRDLATLGFVEGIEDHATLVDGDWPDSSPGDDTIEIAVVEPAAEALGLEVGATLALASRVGEDRTLETVVVGIYRANDPTEGFWWGDPSLMDGLVESEQYRNFGPFLTTSEDFLGRVVEGSARLAWHAYPRVRDIGIDGVDRLTARVGALPAVVTETLPGRFASVETGLPTILADADRSLLVSRTGVLLLMAQLAILAGYAIALTADLIVDHRRLDTALLRSRGAGPLQVGALALAEALLLVLPAALLGPWLASAALRLFNVAGPLAGIGLEIDPVIGIDAYIAAGLAAAGCAALLVLPAVFAARSYAAERAGRARQETRPMGQRLGLDIALVALTAVGLWQLRLYGAPLTQTVQGQLGVDPLLVAAPAIGLLAGSVVALRIVPLLASLAERVTARGRHLVGSLGSRQLARRPLRYTRAALLLMLAMSMGVFAVSYTSTWTASQADQADFRVGADLRVTPVRGPSGLPASTLDTAFAGIDGVGAATPVERHSIRVTTTSDNGQLLALDPETAPGLVALRGDQTATDLTTLFRPLVDERPDVALVRLPDGTQRIRLAATVRIDELGAIGTDPDTGEPTLQPMDVAELEGRASLIPMAVLRDARGLLHRFPTDPVPLANGMQQLDIPLLPGSDRARAAAEAAAATLAYPVDLVGLDIVVNLPSLTQATAGVIAIDGVATSAAADGEDWQPIDVDGAGTWVLGWSQGAGAPLALVPPALVDGLGMQFGGGGEDDGAQPFAALPGVDQFGRGITVSFLPSSVLGLGAVVLPVVVNRPFLDATAARVGDQLTIPIDGEPRLLSVAGALESFPTTDPERPAAIVDVASLGLLRFQSNRGAGFPVEWWLDVDDGALADVLAGRADGPLRGATVLSRAETREQMSADPLALAMIGALSLGFVVAALFAIIGLVVSAAVSARQRRTEFALLRALGLSPDQLSGWLWLENGSLVLVSLVAGTALGLLIGWVVLPFVTVTQQAAVPFPPVLVEVPWASIALLELVSAVALVLTLVALTRVMRRSGLGSVLRMGED
jgi:FtsX-like permease family